MPWQLMLLVPLGVCRHILTLVTIVTTKVNGWQRPSNASAAAAAMNLHVTRMLLIKSQTLTTKTKLGMFFH
jgi:hypothetical protein